MLIIKGGDELLVESMVLGIIVGKIRGGKLKGLATSLLKFSWLIFLSFALQLAISIMISLGHSFFIEYRMILYVITYVLLFVALFFNMRFQCMWFIMIGAIMNFTAIMMNEGSMPVDMKLLEKLGFKNMVNSINMGALSQYIPLEKAGHFTSYLGKRISMPDFYPLSQVFSLGDLFIALGIFFLIQNMMMSLVYQRTTKVIKFDHRKGSFR